MAENKTKKRSESVGAFVEAIPDAARRSDARALVTLMRAASGEVPKMWGTSIVGFGSYHYVYDSGREGDAPLIGFAPRKAGMVLYLHLGLEGAEGELARLGKHTTGKGCLAVRKLADVDEKVLERIIVRSVAAMRKKYGGKSA
ncbi:MAG TPA: DUF1801 domain-containing protein [Rhizomicrobium sp.]|nr:DUF1801 domain-containing protein [Rhizomicrobium sp.]